MPPRVTLRLSRANLDADVRAAEADAVPWFAGAAELGGLHLLLRGATDLAVTLAGPVPGAVLDALRPGLPVDVVGPDGDAVRRALVNVLDGRGRGLAAPVPLFEGALWLHPGGAFSLDADAVPEGLAATGAWVEAARWVSTRRTCSFERLFVADPFHPERPVRAERLEPADGDDLRRRAVALLALAAPGRAPDAPEDAARLRSACATVLSHLVATAPRDARWRAVSAAAADDLLALADAEAAHPDARPMLRAHVVGLLQLRGPALDEPRRARVRTLLGSLHRAAPPYAELGETWRFAMVSMSDFHDGECRVLAETHGFREEPAEDGYRVFAAPFSGPAEQRILVYARSGGPTDETREMGDPAFVGMLVNRHAQLGSFDMRAAALAVPQRGYKLLMNSQCAGLTTRFALARCYPDADLYSSWDSTYFRTDRATGQPSASEGLDCFVAVLRGMAADEDHPALSRRIRGAQWGHPQAAATPGFVQFIGPAHPAVVARYADVNQDGRADLYDGFLDFDLRAIAEDVAASATPRDPGVPASRIGGEAATGLGWAVGSLNRVTQYSDLWAALPGHAELLYPFVSAGFYDDRTAPADLPATPTGEPPASLPAACRYTRDGAELRGEIGLHASLAHSGKELKRLLVAAEAFWRAVDGGLLRLASPLQQRGMLLLTLAGLLEYPADQNRLDALWSAALHMLRLPDLSRSAVRACITDADHDASNYYGSRRGLAQLVAAFAAGDPVIHARLSADDPTVGRAAPLRLQ